MPSTFKNREIKNNQVINHYKVIFHMQSLNISFVALLVPYCVSQPNSVMLIQITTRRIYAALSFQKKQALIIGYSQLLQVQLLSSELIVHSL